jgi:hypothetical protein
MISAVLRAVSSLAAIPSFASLISLISPSWLAIS